MKKTNLVLMFASVLSLGALMNVNHNKVLVNADENILVGEATTYDEMVDIAKRELILNIDESHVVATLNLPLTGLYKSTITWESSNENVLKIDNNLGLITRPTDNNVEVTLTATISVKDNKDKLYTRTKEFKLTVLKKAVSDGSKKTESSFDEKFTSYGVGDEISEYLRWNLTGGQGGAKIVSSVPNNNLKEGSNALMIPSKKTASQTSYVRDFYCNEKCVLEGYTMFTGNINGISFELGRKGIYGPSFGIKEGSYFYNNNGVKIVQDVRPTEGVWTKFRIEVDPIDRSFKTFIYKMDGSNELIPLTGKNKCLYSGSEKNITQFRIRVEGGSKEGEVYLSDLKLDKEANMAANEGFNPNRTDGIGAIENFTESVLYLNGDETNFDKNFIVHNRFDESQIYNEGTDYTLTKETVSTSDKVDVYKYTITLKSTGEIKELIQTVYKEEKTGLPSIENFKGSHLARKVVDKTLGTLSDKGYVAIKGLVSRNDSRIHYAITLDGTTAPSKEEIISGTSSSFIKSGSFNQTEREINYEIDGLDLDKEYALYVVIENDNGSSSIYSKTSISQIINITSCEEFYDMTVNIDTYKNEFRLMNDLDFSNFDWQVDVNNTLNFKGVLNGNNHVIKNLSIQSPYRKAAVFYEIEGATIKNLRFDNPSVSGLQDTAVICGFSNGSSTIENIEINNANISYNNGEGSEGYFAIIVGRLQKDTTTMKNIKIRNSNITCNKYSGILTGNVNKNTNCVLNATNIDVQTNFTCEGAAVGLIGRNRGSANITNAIVDLTVKFAKKEMAIIAGHNKEGGKLNVKNVIGYLSVYDCTQPTYFNYFIGSQDDNTSTYEYEDVYFVQGDFSSISDSINPAPATRTCGVLLPSQEEYDKEWFEKYTFIKAFEIDTIWEFDEDLQRPVLSLDSSRKINAEYVNTIIASIKNDGTEDDHFRIYKANVLYNSLSSEEKAKVNYSVLEDANNKTNNVINDVTDIIKNK